MLDTAEMKRLVRQIIANSRLVDEYLDRLDKLEEDDFDFYKEIVEDIQRSCTRLKVRVNWLQDEAYERT